MKTKTITLPNHELLVVETEPNTTVRLFNGGIWIDLPDGDVNYDTLPRGEWQHLGTVNDVTEEQAETLVEVSDEGFECWDYENNDWGHFGFSPVESLHSLMKANGVLFNNPLGGRPTGVFIAPVKLTLPLEEKGIDWNDVLLKAQKIWDEKQEQVWDKDRTHLFIKQK